MDGGNWKAVIYYGVYRAGIQQNIWKQGIISFTPAVTFIWTQVYFKLPELTVLTISPEINYSALTRWGKMRKISFPQLEQDEAACTHTKKERERQSFFVQLQKANIYYL